MPAAGQRGRVPWNKGKVSPCPKCGGKKIQDGRGDWFCRPCKNRWKVENRKRRREEMQKVCPKCGNPKRLAVYPKKAVFICAHCRRGKERAEYQQKMAEMRANSSTGNWAEVDHGPRWSHEMRKYYDAHRERRMRNP